MTDSPYKFLDPYGYNERDSEYFFGRERETQILLSDIVTSRLVVLFAKTGTGKTSLINAGVRPVLEDREYATFLIRVRRDPVESAYIEFNNAANKYQLNIQKRERLADLLAQMKEQLQQPIVLFFDQFEEFFIYIYKEGRSTASKVGRHFIEDVANAYEDKDFGVHFVFSMREEWFVYMDYFRDEVPKIFHKESNLRLRPFDKKQARKAIICPARKNGVEIDNRLVVRLTRDLFKSHDEQEIEPAQLQIVCDTLWRKKSGGHIRLENYLGFGVEGGNTNIARQITNQRLEEELMRIKEEEHLKLFERLLPELHFNKKTKYVKDFSSLVEILGTTDRALSELLVQLENSGLIQKVEQGRVLSIELSHDYLADEMRLRFMRDRVRAIRLRRIRERGDFVTPNDLGEILDNIRDWVLDREQAEFLFRSALTHGLEVRRWYKLALAQGVPAREILKNKIIGGSIAEVSIVIDLIKDMPELQDAEFIPLLEQAEIKNEVSEKAANVLGVIARSKDTNISSRAKLALAKVAKTRFADTESFLQPPYPLIRQLLYQGKVIPFLGAGASVTSSGAHLPTGEDLASYLAKAAAYPQGEELDLTKVAQYYSAVIGRRALYEELHSIFNRDYSLPSLYIFLASIPTPLLIVTTNFDDLIERAFDAHGRPYGLVIHTTDPSFGYQLLWREHGASEASRVIPNKLDIDLERGTVIYKMHGSVDRLDAERDQYVITEDDYIEFLTRTTKNRAVPAIFAERFQMSHLLYIGYSLRDWNLRVVLNRIEKDLRRPKYIQSWAIQPNPTTLEVRFWQERGVQLYDISIDEFIEKLGQP